MKMISRFWKCGKMRERPAFLTILAIRDIMEGILS